MDFINTIKHEFSFQIIEDSLASIFVWLGIGTYLEIIIKFIKFITIYIISIGLICEFFSCGIEQIFSLIIPADFLDIVGLIIPDLIINKLRVVLDHILYFPFYYKKSDLDKTILDNKLLIFRNEDYRYLILMFVLSNILF